MILCKQKIFLVLLIEGCIVLKIRKLRVVENWIYPHFYEVHFNFNLWYDVSKEREKLFPLKVSPESFFLAVIFFRSVTSASTHFVLFPLNQTVFQKKYNR